MFAANRPASARRRFLPRIEQLECRIQPASVVLPDGFRIASAASGLAAPTAMVFAPDGRLFVAEKGGNLRVISAGGTLLASPFVTLPVNTTSERGLIGVTLDPDFASNGFVYVYYTSTGPNVRNRVSRFREDPGNPNRFDPTFGVNGEQNLLDQIPSLAGNHNGGALHFGTDLKLYIAVGDSGSTPQNAPRLDSLSGKILRINADGSIPADNPFFSTPGARQEIWARGFRNPFTFAFSSTGLLFVNDVGAQSFEEINNVTAGANYGWPAAEGFSNLPGRVNPIHAYGHTASGSTAITGGVFYEATQFPASLQGQYFFADFARGFIRRLNPANNAVRNFARNLAGIVDLDVGPDGSLYALSIFQGAVFRISVGDRPMVAAAARFNGRPIVRVLDGANHAVRFSFFPYGPGFTGTVRLAVGDVNGDGFSDIIVAPSTGPAIIRVFNGLTGALLPGAIGQFRPFPSDNRSGAFVAAGDFNNDGRADIVVGRGSGRTWQVRIFSGLNRAPLAAFNPYGPSLPGGVRVAVGDFNNDGQLDVITAPGPGAIPQIRVFSHPMGTVPPTVLASFLAYDAGFRGGVSLAVGDVDGDDLADIITGPGRGHVPEVRIFRAADLDNPITFLAYHAAFRGGVHVGAGSLVGDGRVDVLTGPGPGGNTLVKIFDAAVLGPPPADSFLAFPAIQGQGVYVAARV